MKRLLFALALVYLLVPRFATAQEDVLGPDAWPTTVDGVVSDLIARLSPEDKEHIRNTPREDLIRFHSGWGTGIRNYYGLWRGNKQLIESACGKPCHPDSASQIIIEKVWEALRKQNPAPTRPTATQRHFDAQPS